MDRDSDFFMNNIYKIIHDLENFLNYQKALGVREIKDVSDGKGNLPCPYFSKWAKVKPPEEESKETLMKNLREEILLKTNHLMLVLNF